MTATLTATITSTRPPTLTPTRFPYDFALKNNAVEYKGNDQSITGNNAGCNWAAIAGTVLNQSGGYLVATSPAAYNVRLSGGTITGSPWIQKSGNKTSYGPSGWEHYLNNGPANNPTQETFTIWLEYNQANGKVVRASPDFTVKTQPTPLSEACNKNLILVTFVQVQPRATDTP
jgi:hypothetical protein